jgi:hypothetical protein
MGCFDFAAVAANVREPEIIREDEQDIGPLGKGGGGRGPGFGDGEGGKNGD